MNDYFEYRDNSNIWSFTEIVLERTGDRETDRKLDNYRRTTMDFFYNIHSMIKTVVHSRLDSSAGNKCEYKDDNDKLLSAIIKYNLKDLGDKKIISCYMIYDTAYFMDVESAASEINDPVIPDSYKRNIFFSAKTDSYFRKLGIFDEAVKRFGKMKKELSFAVAAEKAFEILFSADTPACGSARVLMSRYGESYFTAFPEKKSGEKIYEEKLITKEQLLVNPEKKWYASIERLWIKPYLTRETINMNGIKEVTEKEIVLGVGGLTVTDISEFLDNTGRVLNDNINEIQSYDIMVQKLPTENLPHLYLNDQYSVIDKIFIFSEDFELIEVPLKPIGSKVMMKLTKYL